MCVVSRSRYSYGELQLEQVVTIAPCSDGFLSSQYGVGLCQVCQKLLDQRKHYCKRIYSSVFVTAEPRQLSVCGCALLEELRLSMPHTAVQRLNLAWTSSCQQPGLTKHKVDKLNRAWTDLRICFVPIAGHKKCVPTLVLCSGRHILLAKSLLSGLMSLFTGSIEGDLHVNCRASHNNYWHY